MESHSTKVKAEQNLTTSTITDYLKFIFFCVLLIVPVYAITKSAIDHHWVMMIIDILLVPVGFIHGLLMLSGFID